MHGLLVNHTLPVKNRHNHRGCRCPPQLFICVWEAPSVARQEAHASREAAQRKGRPDSGRSSLVRASQALGGPFLSISSGLSFHPAMKRRTVAPQAASCQKGLTGMVKLQWLRGVFFAEASKGRLERRLYGRLSTYVNLINVSYR